MTLFRGLVKLKAMFTAIKIRSSWVPTLYVCFIRGQNHAQNDLCDSGVYWKQDNGHICGHNNLNDDLYSKTLLERSLNLGAEPFFFLPVSIAAACSSCRRHWTGQLEHCIFSVEPRVSEIQFRMACYAEVQRFPKCLLWPLYWLPGDDG